MTHLMKLEIESTLKGENQLRENCCAVLASQSLDTDIENGLLNFPLKMIGAQTKAQRSKRSLTIRGKESYSDRKSVV